MPNKADVKAWKAQLVAQAEQQILKLTDSDQFKKYLNTPAKFSLTKSLALNTGSPLVCATSKTGR